MRVHELISKMRSALHERRAGRSGRSRGSAQLGLALAAAVIAGGMAVGHGLASHAAASDYPLTWLSDSSRGQLVQVDPAAARSNMRLQVAQPGDPISIKQGDGSLVVVNGKTGVISTIDLSTLLVGGSRTAKPAGKVKVLLAGKRMYVVNLPAGTVQAVDPDTTATIGTAWSAGHPLVDASVDGHNQLWVLESGHKLVRLTWSAARHTLDPGASRSLPGAGAGSVLIGHQRGVTVVGAQGGIDQVGTGHDSSVHTPPVRGPISAPEQSPANLVAISSPGNSSVLIYNGNRVSVVATGSADCANPGIPAVFEHRVYVPCRGAGRVLVLDSAGRASGNAIPTPDGGDPQLVVSAGRLLLNVPGASSVTVVNGSGSTSQIQTAGPSIGVQKPTPPPAPPASTPSRRHNEHSDSHGNGSRHGHGGDAPGATDGHHGSSTATPTTAAPSGSDPTLPAAPTQGPSGAGTGTGTATAVANKDGSVIVSWSSTGARASAFDVTRVEDGADVAQAPAGASSATVTVLQPGTAASFRVSAYDGDTLLWTALTPRVTAYSRPGGVSGVSVSAGTPSGGTATLSVHWNAAAANGGVVTYVVDTGSGAPTQTADTHATVDVPCASTCGGTVTVTPQNAAGDGGAGQASYHAGSAPDPSPTQKPSPTTSTPAPKPKPMPVAGETFVTVTGTTIGSNISGNPATATIELNAPSDWAAWKDGSCRLYDGSLSLGDIACNSAGVQRVTQYYATGTHSYTVVATGGGKSSTSAAASVQVTYRNLPCSNSASETRLTGAGGTVLMPPCPTTPPCRPGMRICPEPRSAGDHALTPADPSRLAALLRALTSSLRVSLW